MAPISALRRLGLTAVSGDAVRHSGRRRRRRHSRPRQRLAHRLLRVPPFIGTLGMYGVSRGAAYLFAGGMTVAIDNDWYSGIGNGRVFGVPMLVILDRGRLSDPALRAVADALRPAHLRDGRQQGGGEPRRHQRQAADAEDLSALGASWAASPAPSTPAASPPARRRRASRCCSTRSRRWSSAARACSAARARSAGTVAGALVIAVIQYGLVFIDVEPFWQFIAVGVVIIISVLVDQTQRRYRRPRR